MPDNETIEAKLHDLGLTLPGPLKVPPGWYSPSHWCGCGVIEPMFRGMVRKISILPFNLPVEIEAIVEIMP